MNKIAVGKIENGLIDLDYPLKKNIKNLAGHLVGGFVTVHVLVEVFENPSQSDGGVLAMPGK